MDVAAEAVLILAGATGAGAAVLVAGVDIADLVDDYLAPEIAEDPNGAFAG